MLRSRVTLLGTRNARSYASTVGGLSALARPKAEQISSQWKGTSATGGNTLNYIGGSFVESSAGKYIDVLDPVRFLAIAFVTELNNR